MNLLEPIAANRVFRVVIRDDAGDHLPAGHLFSETDLKAIKPDGSAVNGGTWITALAGDVLGGRFEVTLPAGLPDQVGTWNYQLQGAGLTDDEWTDQVVDPALVWRAPRAGNQPAGSFGEYFDAKVSAAVRQIQAATPLIVNSPDILQVVQGDIEEPLNFTLRDRTGTPVDVSDANGTITLHWRRPDGTVTDVPLTNVALNLGQVRRIMDPGETSIAGLHRGQVIVPRAGGQQTFPKSNGGYTWTVFPRF